MEQTLKIKQHHSDKVFDIINYSFLGIILIAYIYPLLFILSASISDPNYVLTGEVWLFPKGINFECYKQILNFKDLWVSYKNTILYVLVGVPFSLFLTLTAAYPLSRKDFKSRNIIMAIYAFTMFFGGGLIPNFLLIKNLGLYNKFLVLIIPNAINVFNIIVTRTYFQNSIPDELRDSASIDGCNDFNFLLKIVLPLSTPIIAVMALFYFVDKWNIYFEALIYIKNRNLYPLQVVLKQILVNSQLTADMLEGLTPSQAALITKLQNSMKYGIIIVSSVPVLAVYPFIQKYFVKGIMVGAIKG